MKSEAEHVYFPHVEASLQASGVARLKWRIGVLVEREATPANEAELMFLRGRLSLLAANERIARTA